MQLEERVTRLEEGIYRAGVLTTCVAIGLGFLLPFLAPATGDDEDEPIGMLPAVFATADAGDGPFESQAMVVAIAIGALALVAVVVLIATAATWTEGVRENVRGLNRVLSGLFPFAVACGWLLMLLLSGHTEGDVSPLSPALVALTVGAAGGLLLRAFDRYRLHNT